MGLQRESVPVIVEPLKLPEPAQEPARERPSVEPEPRPAGPRPPEKDPAAA
jgi:hypothetical protein